MKHLTGVSGLSRSTAYDKIKKKNAKENETSKEKVEEVEFDL